MYYKHMGKGNNCHGIFARRGKHRARRKGWFANFLKNMWLLRKGPHHFATVLAYISIVFMFLSLRSAIMLLFRGYRRGLGLAFVAGWIPVIFSLLSFSIGVIIMYGAEWDKSYSTVTTSTYLLHLFYIFMMLNDFINYSEKSDLAVSYMCLLLLFLVETTALLVYAYDVIRNREGDPPSRWWIRTTPYVIIGVIFAGVLFLMNIYDAKESDYSLIFSVAASMLAVNYLVQIINERIVPREGSYKKTHMAVYNRPVHVRPVHRPFSWKAHARRSKPSSSAGREEGAC